MTSFNSDILWQCVLIYSGLGVLIGNAASVSFGILLTLSKKQSLVLKFVGVFYFLVVSISLALLVIDFLVVNSPFLLINIMLFIALSIFSFIFASTAHKGGPILSKLVHDRAK